jgi:hypothetical protein
MDGWMDGWMDIPGLVVPVIFTPPINGAPYVKTNPLNATLIDPNIHFVLTVHAAPSVIVP